MPILMQIVKDHLYDTLFLPENMPNDKAYLFASPVGQYAGRKIKMFDHTNMVMGGMLPAPETFSIREVKCAFYQGGEYLDPLPGVLHLQVGIDRIASFSLSEIADAACSSLKCVRPHDYPEGFREFEDQHRPVIAEIDQQRYFACILEMQTKPEIPTEFIVVLVGDHCVPVREMKPARR
jgi:hypothetical protein